MHHVTFYKKYLQNWRYNAKLACIFHLILLGIPSSLILYIKNRGDDFFLLNRQNLLSMTNVICWRSRTILSLIFSLTRITSEPICWFSMIFQRQNKHLKPQRLYWTFLGSFQSLFSSTFKIFLVINIEL